MRAFRASQQRLDLASKRRVIDLHLNTANNPDISGYLLSHNNLNNIPSHKLLSMDLRDLPISQHLRTRRQHILEPFHQSLRFGPLSECYSPGQEHHDHQDEGEIEVGQIAGRLDDVDDDAEDGTDPEHDCEPVCDLLHEAEPGGFFFLFGKLVVAFFDVSLDGLLGAQTGFQVSAEPVAQFFKGNSVLVHLLDLRCLVIGLLLLGFLRVLGRN